MNSISRPVSEVIKNRDVEEPKKKSREDWRKAKELEEARKAGNAPAAVDEDGKDINPHLPQYISTAPWYFGAKTATLKHQRPQPDKQKHFNKIEDDYIRGLKASICTRFRPGSCENCGAMTHSKKNCFERPRKIGAKYSNEGFAPDEVMPPKLSLDYDGKRDRWNGYDPSQYQMVIDEYAKVEEAKRHLKEEKLKQDYLSGEANALKEQNMEGEGDLDDDDDEEKYADHADMPGTKVDSKQRITVRNLRIREDTAKYLRNLDPNSAYYDPKTRAMRDNPYKSAGVSAEELQYAGDNFVRFTGDTSKHAKTQSFAWETYEKGIEVNLLAEPTKAELLHQEFEVKKEEMKVNIKGGIIDKYGGEEHLKVPPKELIFAQTEDYAEYSRHGQVIKGADKAIVRSKYEEDVFVNNHTSVWGSFWKDHQWGYKCCHSFIKNSYCTGNAGIEAITESSDFMMRGSSSADVVKSGGGVKDDESIKMSEAEENSQTSKLKKKKKKKDKKHKKIKKKETSSESSDDSEEEKAKKLKKALKAEEANLKEADRLLAMDERKRPYNSMYEVKGPTEEEMEAYFMKRHRPDDPMAAFL